MRVQGFDARPLNGSWHLQRNRRTRFAALAVGLVFALLAVLLLVTQAGRPWQLPTASVALLLAMLLLWSGSVREEIALSPRGISYGKGVLVLARRELPASVLKGIHYGPVFLLLRNRQVPAFRVWIDFSDATLPRCVVFEHQLQAGSTDIQQQGEKQAREMASSLGIAATFVAA